MAVLLVLPKVWDSDSLFAKAGAGSKPPRVEHTSNKQNDPVKSSLGQLQENWTIDALMGTPFDFGPEYDFEYASEYAGESGFEYGVEFGKGFWRVKVCMSSCYSILRRGIKWHSSKTSN